MAVAEFTDSPWNNPESELDAADYCAICLIDDNEGNGPKVKDKCKLPIKSKPGEPVNKNALQAAAAALAGARGGLSASAQGKMAAARKVLRLMTEAKMEAGDSIRRIAGMD